MVEFIEDDFWEGCVRLTVESGIGMNFINNPGFTQIINPFLEKFSFQKTPNPSNLKNEIESVAINLQNSIKLEVKNRILR